MNFLAHFFNLTGSINYELSYHYFIPFIVIVPTLVFLFFIYNNPVRNLENKPLGKKSILIVDDSSVVRFKLSKILSPLYEVREANDGRKALELLEIKKADIIITDLEMPNMDGFELISYLHGSLDTENIPIIAITSHEHLTARVTQISRVYGIFTKPWNDRQLLQRVKSLIEIKNNIKVQKSND